MYKVPKMGRGGGPERKHSFLRRCSLIVKVSFNSLAICVSYVEFEKLSLNYFLSSASYSFLSSLPMKMLLAASFHLLSSFASLSLSLKVV